MKRWESHEFTTLQKEILDCLAQGMSTKEIVAQCSCSESSVNHIRTNKKLRSVYSDTCYDVIRGLVPQSIKVLEELIKDKTAPDSIRVAAAKQILDLSRISDSAQPVKEDIKIKVVYE